MLERLEIMKRKKEKMHKDNLDEIQINKFQILELEMTVGCLKSQMLAQSLMSEEL
jgi:hypothetical protein